MVVDMYFHHDTLAKMTNMVKTYITDHLHDDVAAYDVQRIVSILWHRWYYVDGIKGYRAGLTLPAHAIRPLEDAACAHGYCDCFREGYEQGVADREQRPTDLHIADAIVRGEIDRA